MSRVLQSTVLLLCLLVTNVRAQQWVAVPDPQFRNRLINHYNLAGCFNATQDSIDATCPDVQAVTFLTIPSLTSGNVSLEGLSAFSNLRNLDVAPGNLNTVISFVGNLPDSINYLRLYGFSCSSFPTFPASLDTLDFGSITNCSVLPTLPNKLRRLVLTGLNLTTYPSSWPDSLASLAYDHSLNPTTLPANLKELLVGNPQAIPDIPNSLTLLLVDVCYGNVLPVNLSTSSITELRIFGANFTSLPPLPPSLKILEVLESPLTSLPTLPPSLEELHVVTTNSTNPPTLSALPPLPQALKTLSCPANALTQLPALPNGLETLVCSENPGLTVFPPLPSTLKDFQGGANGVTTLPLLPPGLERLWVNSNNLTSLPSVLPPALQYLFVEGNQLTYLPPLPSGLKWAYVHNNPLQCLPILPSQLQQIVISGTQIACVPNIPPGVFINNGLNGYALCDTSNPNGCILYGNVGGKFFVDENSNCDLDTLENLVCNVPYDIYRNGVLWQSAAYSSTGKFIDYGLANDTIVIHIDTAGLPIVLSCGQADTNLIVLYPNDTISTENNFSFGCQGGFDIAAQSITGTAFRPAVISTVNLFAGSFSQFFSADCPAPVGTVSAKIFGASHIVSGNPAPTYISPSGDSAAWDAVDFALNNMMAPFELSVFTDANAPLTSDVCINLSVTPEAGDNNPANNTTSQCFNIVYAYDPNDKQVSPPGDLPPYYDDWLTYTICFQNTGTAEAIDIRVEDTMSQLLDMSSFQLLSYSFPPSLDIDGNVVNFQFSNINLPDSNTNEPASHGFVQFRIKPLTALIPPQQVNNTGYIYFDFNPAVVTNTVTNEVVIPTSVTNVNTDHPEVVVYPNPAKDRWYVQLTGIAKDEAYDILVTDMTGRMINSAIGKGTASVQRNGTPAGMYLMRITTAAGKTIVKKVAWE